MKFTYGIELEGVFSEQLGKQIVKEFNNPNVFHLDGSVRTNPLGKFKLFGNPHPNCGCGECFSAMTEYASPIFTNINQLINNLKKFDNNNYVSDSSCGLHLGIGCPDLPPQNLQALLTNHKLMKGLYNKAHRFCDCQRKRLKDKEHAERYYRFFENRQTTLNSLFINAKYRFAHWHGQYMEFRFLSPCEHRMENILKTINYITSYIKSNASETIHVPRKTKFIKKLSLSFKPLSSKKEIIYLDDESPPAYVYDIKQQKYSINCDLRDAIGTKFKKGSPLHLNLEHKITRELTTAFVNPNNISYLKKHEKKIRQSVFVRNFVFSNDTSELSLIFPSYTPVIPENKLINKKLPVQGFGFVGRKLIDFINPGTITRNDLQIFQ